MGDKTKIDWADATWNPVTGCMHDCEYCYARGVAERFGCHLQPLFKELPVLHEPARNTCGLMCDAGIKAGKIQPYPFDFTPTLHRYRLDIPKRWTRPRSIFVCSMADLFGEWVPDSWIEEVVRVCLGAPQHRYLFLTKNPERYIDLIDKGVIPENQENFWLGSTATSPETPFFYHKTMNTFLSIEPILVRFEGLNAEDNDILTHYVDWIIVGAETGRRKDKAIPEKSWIMELADFAKKCGVPIFMKESLRGIMGEDFDQTFPWEAHT